MWQPQRKLPRVSGPSSLIALDSSMFDRTNYLEQPPEGETAEKGAVQFHISGSFRKFTYVSSHGDADIALFMQPHKLPEMKEQFRALAESLRMKHPVISTNPRVLGGAPHINGLRVSVAHILADIYHLGSIDAVVDKFKQRVSKEQVKEAIAYAHDFMEMTCDPPEADD